MQKEIIQQINHQFSIAIPAEMNNDMLIDLLAGKINQLIIEDFSALVNILYRMDVSEQKLKGMLKENVDADAGKVIAALVIERQIQKLKSRQENSRDENINGEEAW